MTITPVNNLYRRVMLGSDPEVFVWWGDKEEYVPAFAALGGDLELQLSHGTAVCDGMAAEFTVEPSDTAYMITRRIRQNLKDLDEHVKKVNPTAKLSFAPMVPVKPEWVEKLDESYGERASLQIFGCKPDYSVYPFPPIERPDPKTFFWRSSGGHIHMQISEEMWKDRDAINQFVMFLDATIGVAVTAASSSQEAIDRKKLYGKAGYVRISDKMPVVEYRVLTSQALLQESKSCSEIFEAAKTVAQFCVDTYARGKDNYDTAMSEILGSRVLRTAVGLMINSHDIASCYKAFSAIIDRVPAYMRWSLDALRTLKLGSDNEFFIKLG